VMLQILDDGRLTDGQGRTVDLKNTVLIMTSNIGSAVIQEAIEQHPQLKRGQAAYAEMEKAVLAALRLSFRPEFLNRVDEVILFRSLGIDQLRKIVEIQIQRVRGFLAEKNIQLDVTAAAAEKLAGEGYDPAFGARPLKRVIQRLVLDELATKVLAGEIPDGSRIEADFDPDHPDKIAFVVRAQPVGG
ncbi:MAG: AAA family ATPase, partial [Kiritimatiellia bacterium]